jgi:hypothetical protein
MKIQLNKTKVGLFSPAKQFPAISEDDQWIETRSNRVATILNVTELTVSLTFNPHCLLAKRVHGLAEFRNLYKKA